MKDQDMENQEGKSQQNQDNTGKGVGISGQNPGKQEGPQAGSTENMRGESSSNSSGGQVGGGRSDEEFKNNQPNVSTSFDNKREESGREL